LRVLYDLLIDLDFKDVARPENLNGVLTRWAAMPDKAEDGELFEGYYTNVGLKDEFRCLIAALYGRGFSQSKTILHGTANASDIALRCAFYGKAELTKKDMEAGYKRDSGVYVLAAIFNERIYALSALRKLFEEEQIVFSDLESRYQNNLKLIEQGRHIDGAIKPPKPDTRLKTIEIATETLRLRLTELAAELKDTKRLVVIAAIALAIIIYLEH
jgi:hypothetical protein